MKTSTPRNTNIYKEIFISWAGENSKSIAIALKDALEKEIFGGSGLTCFVSNEDISSGDDWWKKINKELKKCKLGILCITKENFKKPWIHFESGAMIARGLKVIPLLFDCRVDMLKSTPLSGRHMVNFNNESEFVKMIEDINDELSAVTISRANIDKIAESAYINFKSEMSEVLKKLETMRVFSAKNRQGDGSVVLTNE